MSRPRRNHRKTVFGLVDPDIGKDGTIDGNHFLNDVVQLVSIFRAQANPLAGLGKFHQIGQRVGIALRIPAAMEQLLPLTDHAHILVVGDKHLYRGTVLHGRRHFLHVHHERRLARNIDHK